ncbi:uncharacterized protein PG998_000475 [Apiospora kogelbergensis]|uniref:uncharacterized protein n=1 Tax=Apiospora kogelbergensis TaxID=1337665 RepID=UPI00312D860D
MGPDNLTSLPGTTPPYRNRYMPHSFDPERETKVEIWHLSLVLLIVGISLANATFIHNSCRNARKTKRQSSSANVSLSHDVQTKRVEYQLWAGNLRCFIPNHTGSLHPPSVCLTLNLPLLHRPGDAHITANLRTGLYEAFSCSMNWTEGNLVRHSRGQPAKNDVLKRQKQHFAKARNRLHNGGSRQSPVTISFLNSPIARFSPVDADFPEHIEIYSDGGQSHSPPACVGSNIDHGQQLLPEYRAEEHGRHGPFGAKPEAPGNDSNLKRTTTRKAENTPERVSRDKRRKLLGNTDWAGLSMQQPLELTFPGQMRVGRTWNNPDQSELNTGKSRNIQQDTAASNSAYQSTSWKSGHVHGDWVQPLSIRRRPIISGRGSSTGIPTVASDSSRISSSFDNRVRQRRKILSHPADHEHVEERHGNYSYPQESRRPLEVTTSNKGSPRTSPACVAYASAPIIQPVPLRANPFQVLRWSPSISLDSGSLDVEIGRPRFRPDAMDIAENEKWKTLVNSSDHLIPLTRGSSLLNSPRMIPVLSPGISEILFRGDKSSSSLTGIAHTQEGERPSPEPHCSLAVNAAISDCGGDPLVVQPLKSQAASLGTGKPNHSNTPNDTDENMAWMKFLFDSDDDKFERCAMQEVTHLAACKMRPSKSSEISSTELSSEYIPRSRSVAAQLEEPAGTSLQSSDGIASTTVTSTSRIATHGSVDSSDSASNHQLEAATINSADDATPDEFPTLGSETSAMNTVISDVETTRATMATSQNSDSNQDAQRSYRFAAPRAFIGKHACLNKLKSSHMPPPNTTGGSKHRGCRKKKASDGRMNIRELPNFDGDPIEDTEED